MGSTDGGPADAGSLDGDECVALRARLAAAASATHVTVTDDHVLLTVGDVLRILRATGSDVTEVGTFEPGEGALGRVRAEGDRAFVSTGSAVLVVDVSEPTAPAEVGRVPDLRLGDFTVSANVLYLVTDVGSGASDWQLALVDVADPSDPLPRGAVSLGAFAPLGGGINDVVVSDGLLVVSGSGVRDGTVMVVDASDPDAPAVTASVEMHRPEDLAVFGEQVYIGGNDLRRLDVGDPSAPEGPFEVGRGRMLAPDGRYLYAVGVLRAYDVAAPTAPVLRWEYLDTGAITDFDVRASVAYLVDSSEGLLVFDLPCEAP